MDKKSLETKQACAALIADFAYFVDHREFADAVALFTTDGVMERPNGAARGHAELFEAWTSRPSEFLTCHICCPPSFREITADSVKTVTYFTIYRVLANGGLPAPLGTPFGVGEFHDEFARTADGWRIKSRKVELLLQGAPDAPKPQ